VIKSPRLHHVQISIPIGSEKQARGFYCGLLGLAEISKPESLAGRGGFWVAVGDQQLHFGVENQWGRADSRRHVALEVAHLALARRQLETEGVEILDSIPIPGWSRLEFRDPFGNRLELMEAVYEQTVE
jgi:catechol 2,3-dioxygenase-like lactoylglutathione lyase family enzyme